MRAIIWLIFIGTAYQLVIQQYVEERRMRKLQKELVNHVIVAGYGMTGKAVAKELLAKKYDKDQIVIIDNNEEAISEAANDDFIGLLGDASRENLLNQAVISRAKHIIIATSRDDTNVLISLTARDMNKNITIIARANQEENTKLLKRSGADIIISPSVAGGRIMAAATHHEHLALYLEDMLTAEHGISLTERTVTENEIGKRPKELPGMVVIGVHRQAKLLDVGQLDSVKLKQGDIILIIEKP
jgi:voltage-gated potassium channel